MKETVVRTDKITLLRQCKQLLISGSVQDALHLLKEFASPYDSGAEQASYSRLAGKLANDIEGLSTIRITFLGNVTLNHWVDCLKFWLLLDGLKLDATIVPFGTWRQQILNKESTLYKSNPDVVWLYLQPGDLNFDLSLTLDTERALHAVNEAVADISAQLALVRENLSSLLVVNNIPARAHRVLGNYEGSTHQSFHAVIQRFNLEIVAALPNGATVFDLSHIASDFGLSRWEDARMWHHSKHPFSLDAIGIVAFRAARLLMGARGQAKKCIVLDLDNTLWGGVVGDDGIDGIRIGVNGGAVGEAYFDFQQWLKVLSKRGIALTICSKNDDTIAKEAFIRKSDMPLQLDDFVAFKANWENKADNIRAIAAELNLGLDAFVFVDDNPVERALVRSELPQIAVPELSTDPAEYLGIVASGGWFETIGISVEDRIRVESYKQSAVRSEALKNSTDLGGYLQSLEMVSHWGAVSGETLQRAAQLVNKTNQFHLTTTRYAEGQLLTMSSSPDRWVGHFTLSDKFGNHGIIAIVVLKFLTAEAVIDTWTMSCRVFSRTMESFIFNIIKKIAVGRGARKLIGVYIPTSKNTVVADLYHQLGGEPISTQAGSLEQRWGFDLERGEITHSTYVKDASISH